MGRCCKKCNITSGCQYAIDCINAEDSLSLLDETFETLFKWYDLRGEEWKRRANPKMWAEVRRQWRECIHKEKK